LEFSNGLILPAALQSWSRHPLTEKSTRNIPRVKEQPAHKAGNFISIVRSMVLRKIFGPKGGTMTRGWEKLRNEELVLFAKYN
jgi:hypothetical protein